MKLAVPSCKGTLFDQRLIPKEKQWFQKRHDHLSFHLESSLLQWEERYYHRRHCHSFGEGFHLNNPILLSTRQDWKLWTEIMSMPSNWLVLIQFNAVFSFISFETSVILWRERKDQLITLTTIDDIDGGRKTSKSKQYYTIFFSLLSWKIQSENDGHRSTETRNRKSTLSFIIHRDHYEMVLIIYQRITFLDRVLVDEKWSSLSHVCRGYDNWPKPNRKTTTRSLDARGLFSFQSKNKHFAFGMATNKKEKKEICSHR